MAEPKVNYTESMVERMLALYAELGNDGIEQIAQELGKPVRAVRSKLVREGAYVAAEKAPKAKREEGPTKKELLRDLEVSKELNDYITGHGQGDVAGEYGIGPSLAKRLEIINRIEHPWLTEPTRS